MCVPWSRAPPKPVNPEPKTLNPGTSGTMDDVTSPGARMRKRAFLHETRRLTKKQGGVTTRHDLILEGVYELEPKPDWRTEQRLATQLGLDPVAVTTWFRNRRVKDKRRNQRVVGTWMLSLVFVVLGTASGVSQIQTLFDALYGVQSDSTTHY